MVFIVSAYGEVLKWWRGSPAKGVGWLIAGARVQIPPSPPKRKSCRFLSAGFSLCIIHFYVLILKSSVTTTGFSNWRLKETAETEYCFTFCRKSEYLDDSMAASMLNDCLEIKRILITSINTAKNNNNWLAAYLFNPSNIAAKAAEWMVNNE